MGETFPAFPAHAQPAILRIWQETHQDENTYGELPLAPFGPLGNCLSSGLRKGTVSGISKAVDHVSPKYFATKAFLDLYLDQLITKGWFQPIGGHVSNHTNSFTASRLALCDSLFLRDSYVIQCRRRKGFSECQSLYNWIQPPTYLWGPFY